MINKQPRVRIWKSLRLSGLVLAIVALSSLVSYHFYPSLWHTRKHSVTESGVPLVQLPVHPLTAPSGAGSVVPAQTTDYKIPPVVNGLAPVITQIPTKEPVVFLTIDDGIYPDPAAASLMQTNDVKASLFLVYRFIKDDHSYFADLSSRTGSLIENHSYDHFLLPGMSYSAQKKDICNNADIFLQWFGRRPEIFRPSGGGYDINTQKAAADCGMKVIALWDVTVNNGKLQYRNGQHGLQPGDIVLMHFRKTFTEDMQAFIDAAKTAGLQTDLLANWLPS